MDEREQKEKFLLGFSSCAIHFTLSFHFILYVAPSTLVQMLFFPSLSFPSTFF